MSRHEFEGELRAEVRRRRATFADGDAGFVPRLCMLNPAERAGPSGTCEDAGASYSGLLAASMSGNGTCQNISHEEAEK